MQENKHNPPKEELSAAKEKKERKSEKQNYERLTLDFVGPEMI